MYNTATKSGYSGKIVVDETKFNETTHYLRLFLSTK